MSLNTKRFAINKYRKIEHATNIAIDMKQHSISFASFYKYFTATITMNNELVIIFKTFNVIIVNQLMAVLFEWLFVVPF